MSFFTPAQKEELYTPNLRGRLAGYDGGGWLLSVFESVRKDGIEDLDTLLAVDVRSYLPYDLLVKMDIATMACSLEARSPFLDHKVMEFAARLPASLKMRGKSLKYIKPDNIFLGQPERRPAALVRVLDFGIARIYRSDEPEKDRDTHPSRSGPRHAALHVAGAARRPLVDARSDVQRGPGDS